MYTRYESMEPFGGFFQVFINNVCLLTARFSCQHCFGSLGGEKSPCGMPGVHRGYKQRSLFCWLLKDRDSFNKLQQISSCLNKLPMLTILAQKPDCGR